MRAARATSRVSWLASMSALTSAAICPHDCASRTTVSTSASKKARKWETSPGVISGIGELAGGGEATGGGGVGGGGRLGGAPSDGGGPGGWVEPCAYAVEDTSANATAIRGQLRDKIMHRPRAR